MSDWKKIDETMLGLNRIMVDTRNFTYSEPPESVENLNEGGPDPENIIETEEIIKYLKGLRFVYNGFMWFTHPEMKYINFRKIDEGHYLVMNRNHKKVNWKKFR